MPADISFLSHGDRCAAWHLTAGSDALTGPHGQPCVVMAHGFGATRDCGLLPFAERFAAAGCDVLLFDYRGYADSEGRAPARTSTTGGTGRTTTPLTMPSSVTAKRPAVRIPKLK